MGDGPTTGLLANLLTQPEGGASIPATGTIWLGETAPTAKAFEAPFMQHQHDAVPTQGDIPFASQTGVMHFGTDTLTIRATGSLTVTDHIDINAAIRLYHFMH